MAACQWDIGTCTGSSGAFQHLCGYGGREFFQGPTQNGNGHKRGSAHGINITDGVDRGNLAEVKRVIDNRHKEVGRADHRFSVAQIIYCRVILGIIANQ